MKNFSNLRKREYMPYVLMLVINIGFIVTGFSQETPGEVFTGFSRIIQSRSILITDYIAVGGIGATLLNVGIVGISCIVMLIRLDLKPGGANIMGVWLSMGFAFFGKNVFNMIPLTIGVFLYAKYSKHPFKQHYLGAMLVATLSPTISEIAFLGMFSRPVEILAGIMMGFAVGFIFPVISADSVKVHSGFNLYNMGFAGGVIATVLSTVYRNLGIEIIPSAEWSYGNNVFLATLLFTVSLLMLVTGLFFDGNPKKILDGFRRIHGHSGRLLTDFYQMYENSIFVNMAVLCALGTGVVLILNGDLNGPNIAGILTMAGFGSLGKHARNVTPIMLGCMLSVFANRMNLNTPGNIVIILFSTGLAPVAGTYGWKWGIAAGFLHLNIATYIGNLNSGLNLYNNGFAASFVLLFLLPVISIFRKEEKY